MSFTVARLITLINSDSYPSMSKFLCNWSTARNMQSILLQQRQAQQTCESWQTGHCRQDKGIQQANSGSWSSRNSLFDNVCAFRQQVSVWQCVWVCMCAMCAPGCLFSGFAPPTSYDLFRKQWTPTRAQTLINVGQSASSGSVYVLEKDKWLSGVKS